MFKLLGELLGFISPPHPSDEGNVEGDANATQIEPSDRPKKSGVLYAPGTKIAYHDDLIDNLKQSIPS